MIGQSSTSKPWKLRQSKEANQDILKNHNYGVIPFLEQLKKVVMLPTIALLVQFPLSCATSFNREESASRSSRSGYRMTFFGNCVQPAKTSEGG